MAMNKTSTQLGIYTTFYFYVSNGHIQAVRNWRCIVATGPGFSSIMCPNQESLKSKYGYNIFTTFKNLFCNARYSSLKVLERKKIMKNLTFPISLTSIKQCMIEVYEYHYINLCAKTRKMRCILYIKIFDPPLSNLKNEVC